MVVDYFLKRSLRRRARDEPSGLIELGSGGGGLKMPEKTPLSTAR